MPGTDDGKPNPDFRREIIASMPSGDPWCWQAPQFSDPFQGCSYHLSKTKDAATGDRWARFERFIDTIPVAGTVHSDAYRDISDSWETDESGFIAEDEEATCGLAADHHFWAAHGLSFGVEGGNGALVAVGPVPGFAGIVSYYYHGSAGPGAWARIVSGTTQGLDNDISSPAGPSASQRENVYVANPQLLSSSRCCCTVVALLLKSVVPSHFWEKHTKPRRRALTSDVTLAMSVSHTALLTGAPF